MPAITTFIPTGSILRYTCYDGTLIYYLVVDRSPHPHILGERLLGTRVLMTQDHGVAASVPVGRFGVVSTPLFKIDTGPAPYGWEVLAATFSLFIVV